MEHIAFVLVLVVVYVVAKPLLRMEARTYLGELAICTALAIIFGIAAAGLLLYIVTIF